MIIKTCDMCHTDFEAPDNRTKRCSSDCKAAAKVASQARKDKKRSGDPRRRATQKAFDQSPAGRRSKAKRGARYFSTPKGKEAQARKSAGRRGAPCNGTRKHYRAADACVRCGSVTELELEHMTPCSQGGTNYIENLTTMCRECNRGPNGKHTLGPQDWPVFVRWFLESRINLKHTPS